MDFDPLKQPPIHMPIVYGPIPSWKKPKILEKGDVSEDQLIPLCKICEGVIVVSVETYCINTSYKEYIVVSCLAMLV